MADIEVIELKMQSPDEATGKDRRSDQKKTSFSKPYEPYEVNVHQAFSAENPTYSPTRDSVNPTLEESLGQNQVADIVSKNLRHTMAWDTTSNQWYERPDVNSPFTERDSDFGWLEISNQIGLIKPKYTAGFVSGVERFIKAQLAIAQWDTSNHLLPVSNGVFDLDTRKLRAYTDADRFNWQLPYPYDPEATCSTIDGTLSRMVGGDSALIRFLESWLLVVLLGRYDVQAFLELVGDGGTGKSTFLRLLALLVGDENVRSTDLHSLEHNQFETAGLYGKRLTLITDSARYRGEVPVLKAITGGDPVRLERKHVQQRKPFIYRGLVAIAANQPLESSDYSSGLKRRRRALNISYRVSESDRKKYRDKRKHPEGFEGELKREMSGLLNRLLALNVDDAVSTVASPEDTMQEQSLSIELETNPLLAWADERLVKCLPNESETRIGDLKACPGDGLYKNYADYIEAIGQRPLSLTRFSRALLDVLTSHGVSTSKERGVYTYMSGMRLRRAADNSAGLVSGSKALHVGLSAEKRVAEGFVGSKQISDFSASSDDSISATPDKRRGIL